MGDHHVRVGFDKEKLDFARVTVRTGADGIDAGGLAAAPGGLTYIYRTCGAATSVCTGATPAQMPGDEYVELNFFNSGGSFYAENTAYYFQDDWQITDQLTLGLGVRWDQFANFTADGSQFIDFDKELAPRVGFSYDVFGDGRTKLYGNFGVYYLPVASNTAFRQGAREYYFREYWEFSSIGANGLPVLGSQIVDWTGGNNCPFGLIAGSAGAGSASCNVTGDGSVQDPTASISRNLEATKEKEIIVGFEHHLSDLLTVGVNYTHRNLATTAEDVAIDAAVIAYCNDAANMVNQLTTSCSSIWTGYHQYTIINPGSDSTIVLNSLLPGEATPRTVEFSAADLGYPKAKRSYDAVEFTFQRAFDGVWSLRGSYTWSKSKGNTEGGVQSDFGQTDTGITQDFDQPGFTDGSYGFLPNHRAHRVRLFGSYQVMEDLLVGANVQIDSPRQFSCFGFNPTNGYANFENGYGAASHYCGGVLSPRGEGLNGDWTFDASTSVRYNIELPTGSMMTLRADVFNIFNGDGVLSIDEQGEDAVLTPRTQYGSPLSYQAPRRVRLGLDIEF
jgi:hypothetical protein